MKQVRINEKDLRNLVFVINRKLGSEQVRIMRYIDWYVVINGIYVNDKQWKNRKVYDYLWEQYRELILKR